MGPLRREEEVLHVDYDKGGFCGGDGGGCCCDFESEARVGGAESWAWEGVRGRSWFGSPSIYLAFKNDKNNPHSAGPSQPAHVNGTTVQTRQYRSTPMPSFPSACDSPCDSLTCSWG